MPYFLYNYIIILPLNSSKPDPVCKDSDPCLQENIAYVAVEPAKEEEADNVYEPYTL